MNLTPRLISLSALVDKHQNQICGQLLVSVGDTNVWDAFGDSQPSIICSFLHLWASANLGGNY